MISKFFLSSSIPLPGRKFYGSTNDSAIVSAVMAFTRVCAENNLPFYFGGHPAISPLVWSVAKDYRESLSDLIWIYQSEYFRDYVPKEVEYYNNIVWTPNKGSKESSLEIMRKQMFAENTTSMAVFIGGMDGIEREYNMLVSLQPNVKVIPFASVGGASEDLYNKLNIDNPLLEDNFAFMYIFNKLLKNI